MQACIREKLQSDSLLSRSWSSKSLDTEVIVSWKFDDTFEWLSTNGEGWYTMLSGLKLIMWSLQRWLLYVFISVNDLVQPLIPKQLGLLEWTSWMCDSKWWNLKPVNSEHKGQLYVDISLTSNVLWCASKDIKVTRERSVFNCHRRRLDRFVYMVGYV